MPSTTLSPVLQPPGAGLPPLELSIARIGFTLYRQLHTRQGFSTRFTEERDRLLTLAHSCSPEQAAQRVLIRRLAGLEDSSRYWSVWMTLDHLRIVNNAITGAISLLSEGKVPPEEASTASVKPDPGVDARVVEAFQQTCTHYLKTVEKIPDLKTTARYAHPWFGPLDGSGWHALIAFHMNLHRWQVERIIAGLS